MISQSFFPKLGFDPTQFVPITIMAKLPYILVVHPKVPVSTFAEFIAYAKANPNKLNDASPFDRLRPPSHRRNAQARRRHQDDARALFRAWRRR